MSSVFYRPKSKETSAFPKSYPLWNRAIGDEMTSMLTKAPSSWRKRSAQAGVVAPWIAARVATRREWTHGDGAAVNMRPDQPSDN
jgi:hypothetical protein